MRHSLVFMERFGVKGDVVAHEARHKEVTVVIAGLQPQGRRLPAGSHGPHHGFGAQKIAKLIIGANVNH